MKTTAGPRDIRKLTAEDIRLIIARNRTILGLVTTMDILEALQ